MPVFTPPIVLANPPVLPDTRGIQYRLFRYLGPQPVGRSVVKIGGEYTTIEQPDQLLLAELTDGVDYFLGGHVYEVSIEIAQALVAAGYADITYMTWGALGGTSWDDLPPAWSDLSGDWATLGRSWGQAGEFLWGDF